MESGITYASGLISHYSADVRAQPGNGIEAMHQTMRIIALIVCLVVAAPATPAEITVREISGLNLSIVGVKGEITAGDANTFFEAVSGIERATVILRSPGGLLRDALQIGAEIRTRDFSTMVPADAECYSACGLIWVSGARRYMSRSSKIGFQAADTKENREYEESDVADAAEIGSFLTHLGLRIEAIRFFTVAGPLLSLERARVLGIQIYEQDGDKVIAADQRPGVDVYVDRFVAFGFLQTRCSPFFHPQSSVNDDGAKSAFEKGNEIADNDLWIKLMLQQLEVTKEKINSKGVLLHCIDIEAKLRGQGLPTGIDGPSFKCSAGLTPTERTLCDDENLWAKDRAISAIYFYIRENVDSAARKRLQLIQREWLAVRDSCGGNKKCLNQSYDQRLGELREVDIPS